MTCAARRCAWDATQGECVPPATLAFLDAHFSHAVVRAPEQCPAWLKNNAVVGALYSFFVAAPGSLWLNITLAVACALLFGYIEYQARDHMKRLREVQDALLKAK